MKKQIPSIISILLFFAANCIYSIFLNAQQLHIYLANDNHTDYLWTTDSIIYNDIARSEIDYYLDLTDNTIHLPTPYQNRYNLDGAWYLYEYRKSKPPQDFDRLISGIRSGHISVPFNYLVSTYGGQTSETILRGMYWAGRIDREYNLNMNLAVGMENQTQPLGLASLWAGSGVKYSWKGVCNCASPIQGSGLANRANEIFKYQGIDGTGVLMKWYSITPGDNKGLGGYAEARNPLNAISACEAKSNTPAYPYNITGAFGYGHDDGYSRSDVFVQIAQPQSNAGRQIHISNEADFFEHFLSEYDINSIPAETMTYGNDWDLNCAAMAPATTQIRNSIEKLRSAEALASIVSLYIDPGFYPAINPQRDQVWIDMGTYWDHNFSLGGCCVEFRNIRQLAIQQRAASYVDELYNTALDTIATHIPNNSSNSRFFVFNSLGWQRTDIADLEYQGDTNIKIIDLQTNMEAPHQIILTNNTQYLRILATDIPSVGYKTYEIRPEEGGSFPDAAILNGNIFENDFYSLTVTSEGVVTSLIDKLNGNQELVKETGGRFLNDFGQGSGEQGILALSNNGPVSATISCTSDHPLNHTTSFTLYNGINRVDIANHISDSFGNEPRTYSFSFDFDTPTIWHEELGAVIKAKYTTNGGHYATPNLGVRHDWQTLNHFVDIGQENRGVILSNQGAPFMKIGNSSTTFLDEGSSQINVLIGGLMYPTGSIPNQYGLTEFRNNFAIRARTSAFDAAQSMQFAMEHQNPLAAKMITGSGNKLPQSSFSLLEISAPKVLLMTLKPAEEGLSDAGLILRAWNMNTQAQSVTFEFDTDVLSANKTTHLETNIESAVVEQNALATEIGQQRMETFRIFLDTIASNCSLQSSINASICQGETFEGYTQTGSYSDTFTTANGCDSIRNLNLTVLPNAAANINASICQGEAFEGYTQTGSYSDTFTAANGCDSIRNLNLTVLPNAAANINVSICQGEAFEGYTQTGNYSDTFTAANGCDSTRTLILTVLPNDTLSIGQTTCDPEQAGLQIDTFPNQNSCDSIVLMNIIFVPLAYEVLAMDVRCFGFRDGIITIESSPNYAITWEDGTVGPTRTGLEAGNYTFTLIDPANGCFVIDSVAIQAPDELQANLETHPASSGTGNDGSASVAPTGGHPPYMAQWSTGESGFDIDGLTPGFYEVTITDANGCTDTFSFEISLLNSLSDIPSLLAFELYPNPASEQLYLKLRFHQKVQGKIIVNNLSGREVYTEVFEGRVHQSAIPVEKFPASLYQIRVAVGQQEVVKTVAIE